MPSVSYAFGFGVPVVNSHLDESLNVTIPISLEFGETTIGTKVRVATPEDYRALNVHYNNILSSVSVVTDRKNGQSVHLKSTLPIVSPVLHVVLKSTGKDTSTHYKKFELLIDPEYNEVRETTSHKPVRHYRPIQKGKFY